MVAISYEGRQCSLGPTAFGWARVLLVVAVDCTVPLLLTLQIILRKVAGLAHAGGIVGPISVFTLEGHPALALAVIALVAHVLGVVLLLKVIAHEVGGGVNR